jgi:hypothetical protein
MQVPGGLLLVPGSTVPLHNFIESYIVLSEGQATT